MEGGREEQRGKSEEANRERRRGNVKKIKRWREGAK